MAASWIAAGSSILVIWIIDQAVLLADGNEPGKVTPVFIIMFVVARWIMTRDYASTKSPLPMVSTEIRA